MADRRIDTFSRLLGSSGSRRGALRTFVAGALGGAGAVAVTKNASARTPFALLIQNADLGEKSVLLYEQLADLVAHHTGTCEEMSADIQALTAQNKDLISQIQDDESTWTRDQLLSHNSQYADRLDAATATIQFGRLRCATREPGGAEATPCATSSSRNGVRALPSADTCDCSSECPQSVGSCILSAAECAAGSNCECCWTSYCGSTSHCMTDCDANACCSGVSGC